MLTWLFNLTGFGLTFPIAVTVETVLLRMSIREGSLRRALLIATLAKGLSAATVIIVVPGVLLAGATAAGWLVPAPARYVVLAITTVVVEQGPRSLGRVAVGASVAWLVACLALAAWIERLVLLRGSRRLGLLGVPAAVAADVTRRAAWWTAPLVFGITGAVWQEVFINAVKP